MAGFAAPITGRFCAPHDTVRLFSGLARHRVSWIAEADPSSKLQASKSALIVESIEW
jgi:hypothetical protein